MVEPSHLRSFQALELAIRTGSLKGAADMLSITPAAVGQRVKALEDYLGIELLVRGRSGLRATPALGATYDHLATAFRELGVVADALDMQRGQEIRVAAVSDFAEMWLAPRLGAFRRDHPNVVFSINGEGGAPQRITPVDCEITFGPPPATGRSDFLFQDFLAPISSPENTDRILKLPKRDRVEGFPLLHLDFYKEDPAALNWSTWVETVKLKRSAPERGTRFQRISIVAEAVRANAGLAICGLALIREQVEDGTISLPFSVASGAWTHHAFQARFRSDTLFRAPVRRFREWLLQESAATSGWLTEITKAITIGGPTPRC